MIAFLVYTAVFLLLYKFGTKAYTEDDNGRD